MKTKKKGKTRRRVIIIVVVVVVILLIALLVMRRRNSSSDSGGSGSFLPFSTTSTSTEEAYIGDIRIVTEGEGSIEPVNELLVDADYTLQIDTVEVEAGDIVSAGDLIATLDRDSVDVQIAQYEQQLSEINSEISNTEKDGSSTLTAPVSGRVKRIYVKSDEVLSDVVTDHGGVMEISADGKLKVEFESDDSLKLGDTVTVNFLSYEVDGIIESREDDVYTVTIEDGENYLVDTEATVTDDDDKVLGTGTLQSNHPYLVDASYGIADEIRVDVGDSVSSGDTLLTRTNYSYNGTYLDLLSAREDLMEDLQTLRELREEPELTAEADGIVSDLFLTDGMIMQEDTEIYSLISTDEFYLKVNIDELEIDGIEVGETATVVFDAFDTEEYTGTIEKISALGQNSGGVTKYTTTISVPGSDKLKTNMSATATIVTDEKEDVLLVSVDAIQTSDGKNYVTKVDENGDEQLVEVTLGLVNNAVAEVTDGLSEGDKVEVTTSSDFSNMLSMVSSNLGGGSSSGEGGSD